MLKSHHHMTREQRCQIQLTLSMRKTQRQIADQINVNQSAISREIARNSDVIGYIFNVADERAIKR
jgi:IS30 family transposase